MLKWWALYRIYCILSKKTWVNLAFHDRFTEGSTIILLVESISVFSPNSFGWQSAKFSTAKILCYTVLQVFMNELSDVSSEETSEKQYEDHCEIY